MRVKFVVSHGGEYICTLIPIGIFLIESEMLVFAKNVPKPKPMQNHRQNVIAKNSLRIFQLYAKDLSQKPIVLPHIT